jgi:hypothetical protein
MTRILSVNDIMQSATTANQIIAHVVKLLNEIGQLRAELEAKELELNKYVVTHRVFKKMKVANAC